MTISRAKWPLCIFSRAAVALGLTFSTLAASVVAEPPAYVRGVYLTSASFGQRKVEETIHYAKHTGMNAVVLHVKDPYGHIHWDSQVPVAREIGAFRGNGRLLKAIQLLRDSDMWVIAKLDLFQDTLLAEKKPDWALLDVKTGKPWRNKRDLAWANPCDKRVWAYDVALAKELVQLGVNEIQFDYIRFPSDGDFSRLDFDKVLQGATKIDTIGQFLKCAHDELKPLGVTISVDLFGFVAWKTDDFGVGQRIEEIAPHVDAVCPMLYPSHFPPGFLGMKDPSEHPKEIMERSVAELQKRTKTDVRPWIQGFWYTPKEVNLQLDGVDATDVKSWLVWSPSSNYDVSFEALAKRLDITIPAPKLYPDLSELEKGKPREVRGLARVVSLTDYANGCTMLCLEGAVDGKTSHYNNPTAVVQTLDEAVMDRILQQRGIPFDVRTSPATKTAHLVTLVCKDLNVSVTRMRVKPVYIDWRGDCRFTYEAKQSVAKADPNPKDEKRGVDSAEKAPPKKGRTVGPPLSAHLPDAFSSRPSFGAIEWRVEHLPWVGEGPDEGVSGMGMVSHDGSIYVCGGWQRVRPRGERLQPPHHPRHHRSLRSSQARGRVVRAYAYAGAGPRLDGLRGRE